MEKSLLSIDWDYFIKIRPEWCGSYIENERCLVDIWYKRYIEENIRGINLEKEIYINTNTKRFWNFIKERFNLKKDIEVFISDSHKFSYKIAKDNKCDNVILFDAHSDLGYGGLSSLEFELNCANWLGKLFKDNIINKSTIIYSPYTMERPNDFSELNSKYNIEYVMNRWDIEYEQFKNSEISAIHICRSGAWSPPWLDKKFYEFIRNSELKVRKLEDITRDWNPKKLTFSDEINYLIG